jgi:HK97 family phage prohead protease
MKLERRYFDNQVTIENRVAGELSRKIRGYAAKFETLSQNLGWFREKIARGAFDNVLENDVVALFNHNIDLVLARTISKTLAIGVDETGLWYEFEAPNTTAGNDLLEMVNRGDVQHSSFSFSIQDEKWEQDDESGEIRTVLKVKRLYDVSPVVSPAYKDTEVDIDKRAYNEFKESLKPDYNDLADCEAELEHRKNLL